MTIEEIYYSEDISVRSFNVCNQNNLNDLSAILKHYRESGTFENLRNCGKKSNEELMALCVKYIEYEVNNSLKHAKIESPYISLISNLTRTQREIVNSFIEINSNNLSNRSRNAISTFLNGNLKFRNINEKILANERFNIQDIKNVGTKSTTELNNFIISIKEFIENVSITNDEINLVSLKNRFFIEKSFSIAEIPIDILESLSVFKLTDFLLNRNAIFEKNENIIFQKAFKVYQNQLELTLDEIAEQLDRTKERVRQIRKSILKDLFKNFQFVKNIEDDLFQKNKIDINQEILFVDDDLCDFINYNNGTNFSKEFISYLIFVYTFDKFTLIGNVEDVLVPKYFNSKNRHNWEYFYLVDRIICDEFRFNDFADDIDKRLSERIEETYSFHFKSYLNNFVKTEDSSTISLIFPLAERIINQEFDLLIDLNENVTFKRNTFKQIPEYAIEALEKLGSPSSLEEIYNLIERENPEVTKSKLALRGTLQRIPEIICFGRSSTYGLKKWEKEKEGIKGGTIKDIIFEYLQDKTDPIHILELLNEVHKYREKTNAKSIIGNLKLDPQKQFIIFNQSFIGLSGKTYNSSLTFLPKVLGRNITNYISKQKCTNRITIEEYFSIQLNISQKNMNYIIDYLIEQQFVFIDNQNNLII
ncbi:MAG: sigma factor-like helix-turn-helix DNA-binding protein [Algoriphagus sp.]|uniref:sigma factor-like helix-turn-helix DNA-binding protein n=1 Tax=Algoriphagus sp. TaxID=1872435 RepID=UPI002639F3E3|nr:sigma factor-like helix-turn-helix DNA-binding protein [Algoriphagus sp.]MDG1279625.1 sigma factor-like helix-turn-helix DNA-binding protein [Algoriphagus sp.]